MNLAREMVRDYDFQVDRAQDVVDLLGIDGVLALLADMVARGDADEVADATLFVNDMALLLQPPGFRRAYDRSALVQAIRGRMRDPVMSIRACCLHTLGKTGHRPSAGHVEEAFPWYLKDAPLEVGNLLSTLLALKGSSWPCRHHLERTAAAPLWLARWAALGFVTDDFVDLRRLRRLHGPEKQLLRRLAQDPHPWVRAEARWALDIGRGGPPHRGRQVYLQRRAAGRPFLTFATFETLVRTYLGVSGDVGYDADLCTALGQHVKAHPVPSGWDPADYWQPVLAERQRGARGAPSDHGAVDQVPGSLIK